VNQVIDWIKANVFIVIFAVLILVAFVALPVISSSLNAEVEETLSSRKKLDRDLTQLTNTPVDIADPTPWFQPGTKGTALVNPASLEEMREYAAARNEEVQRLVEAAAAHNRKGRSVLMPDLFPKPSLTDSQVMKKRFSEALNGAYRRLLEEINAGQPPSLDTMQETLVRREGQFISSTLAKRREDLTAEDRELLREELAKLRIGLVEDAAQTMATYASLGVINLPSWDYGQTPEPTLTELFYWQWDYWIIEDIFRAVDESNSGSTAVPASAVKRIRSIDIYDSPGDAAEDRADRRSGRGGGSSGGQAGGGPFLSGGGTGGGGAQLGGGGGAGRGQQQAEEGAGAKPADPAQEVVRDYSVSFTGRKTNPLYDVRYARVYLVVENDRIPEVLDAIGAQNFMTITDMEIWPTDPVEALEAGYVYGPDATSNVRLEIESVWLRSWTSQWMPEELKRELGLPVGAPNSGDGSNP